MYPIGVTILMPSGNELNNHIAEIVLSQSKNVDLSTTFVGAEPKTFYYGKSSEGW